ncbi:hypothetical protein [Fructilactobacillus lindneri]|uniref:hypothetical protein n=1 Tax=Fructilactobacillus lindneri TaxID=53444 RepID=UPI000CD401CE|nr:hypothetical protein [Fructilactobacillus lindneri]
MPIVAANWIDKLTKTVNHYMVLTPDETDTVSLQLTRDTKNVDNAINYIASKKVVLNAKG